MAELMATAAVMTSDAFVMGGRGKLSASGLVGDEIVKLLEEGPDGTYRHVNDRDGIGVTLTVQNPSIIVEGYGNYKASKAATTAIVTVRFDE